MTKATEQEAVREWAWNVGYEDCYKDRMWICSNYDTWERNPHYQGPEQIHPELECEDWSSEEDDLQAIIKEVSSLREPVRFNLSFCEIDMSRNEVPF